MFVARDKDGKLKCFGVKPYKIQGKWGVDVENGMPIFGFNFDEYIVLPAELYPELTWEDEPLEVELTAISLFDRFIDDIIHKYIAYADSNKFNSTYEIIKYITNEMKGEL